MATESLQELEFSSWETTYVNYMVWKIAEVHSKLAGFADDHENVRHLIQLRESPQSQNLIQSTDAE